MKSLRQKADAYAAGRSRLSAGIDRITEALMAAAFEAGYRQGIEDAAGVAQSCHDDEWFEVAPEILALLPPSERTEE